MMTVKDNFDSVSHWILELEKKLQPSPSLMNRIGEQAATTIQKNLEGGRDQKMGILAPLKRNRPKPDRDMSESLLGKETARHVLKNWRSPPLIDTGQMLRSIKNFEEGADSTTIKIHSTNTLFSTNKKGDVEYSDNKAPRNLIAYFHQYGTKIHPARPFFPTDTDSLLATMIAEGAADQVRDHIEEALRWA